MCILCVCVKYHIHIRLRDDHYHVMHVSIPSWPRAGTLPGQSQRHFRSVQCCPGVTQSPVCFTTLHQGHECTPSVMCTCRAFCDSRLVENGCVTALPLMPSVLFS